VFPSNRPNYAADSIYTLNRILFQAVRRVDPSVVIGAIGPPDMPAWDDDIELMRIELGASKFHARFGFPWAELRQALASWKPDVPAHRRWVRRRGRSGPARDALTSFGQRGW